MYLDIHQYRGMSAQGARSAGSAPGPDVHLHVRSLVTDDAVRAADVVVTIGCGDACPFFPGKRCEDWKLDDPAGRGMEADGQIRDEIKTRVEALISELLES